MVCELAYCSLAICPPLALLLAVELLNRKAHRDRARSGASPKPDYPSPCNSEK